MPREVSQVVRLGRLISAVVVLGLAVGGPGAGAGTVAPSRPNPPFRLADVSACFFAPMPGPARWPLWPTGRLHPIQGSFDEPRGNAAHFGVDIPAHENRAPVYAMLAGRVVGAVPRHLTVMTDRRTELYYWHVRHLPGVVEGTYVRQGQLIGHVVDGAYHVHIGEMEAGCRWVNPLRPTGPFTQPANREPPTIGTLRAYAATSAAFTPFDLQRNPALQVDPATPQPLSALHGVVDLRARVYDWPTVQVHDRRQLELMPAAIRAWLAPVTDRHRHVSRLKTIFNGAGLLRPTALGTTFFHIWAFGTWRQGVGYRQPGRPPDHVGADYVWHVGGTSGLHTAQYPNGDYLFCVQALTINGVRGIRCTPVTIAN